MDRGAAAREKNGANNLATNDRDNRIPQQSHATSKKEQKSPGRLERKACARKIARRPLTHRALSGTGQPFSLATSKTAKEYKALKERMGSGRR